VSLFFLQTKQSRPMGKQECPAAMELQKSKNT